VLRRNGSRALWPLVITLGLGASGNAQKLLTFDALGAGTAAYQGTFAYGINTQGLIAGFYLDAKYVYHGFIRSPLGILTSFEAPGAGDAAGSYQGTYALGINSQGAITGFYRDANYVSHGFLRNSDGTFATFEAPGSGEKAYQGTFAYSINSEGEIAGFYLDVNDLYHGFLRSSGGVFTTFDAPRAGNVLHSDQGTLPGLYSALNTSGAIAGFLLDAKNVYHGFLRSSNSVFTTFEAPGANTSANSYRGTVPASINDSGVVTGYYIDASGVRHGFLRSPNGTFTVFDAPGAGTRSGQGTLPTSINDLGAITGYCISPSGVYNGFVRPTNGSFLMFNASGAGTRAGQGTHPLGNEAGGAITGYYADARNVNHGFLLTH
jgi:hypothetical protein